VNPRLLLLPFLFSLTLTGCATTRVDVLSYKVEGIEKIAVIIRLTDNQLQVFNQTGPQRVFVAAPATPAGLASGFVAAGATKAILAEIKVRKSLGGNPDELQRELKDFSVEETFDRSFAEVFRQELNIIDPEETKNIQFERNLSDGIVNYSPLRERFGTDAVLIIDFQYGLAAYAKGPASTAINADVTVVKIAENRVLLSQSILCDTPWLGGHSLAQYKADNARLFKEEIAEAAKSLARVMVVHFTMAPSTPPKKSESTTQH
jgi:hypothetical protein